VELKDKIAWIYRGYRDAKEETPYKRSPNYSEEILQLNDEQAPIEVKLYWEGWKAGINDKAKEV